MTHVAMESTGVYWRPVYVVLEDDFELLLVNARHIKHVPGRKTDVRDCEWVAQLLECGLLRGSFVPPPEIRDLRDLTRLRKSLIGERSRQINRVAKTLEMANIKLGSVVTDIMGMTGRAILDALVAGVEAPETLAGLAQGSLKKKRKELAEALKSGSKRLLATYLQTLLAYPDGCTRGRRSSIPGVATSSCRCRP